MIPSVAKGYEDKKHPHKYLCMIVVLYLRFCSMNYDSVFRSYDSVFHDKNVLFMQPKFICL